MKCVIAAYAAIQLKKEKSMCFALLKQKLLLLFFTLSLAACQPQQPPVADGFNWQSEVDASNPLKATLRRNFDDPQIDFPASYLSGTAYADKHLCEKQDRKSVIANDRPVKVYDKSKVLELPIDCIKASELPQEREINVVHIDG